MSTKVYDRVISGTSAGKSSSTLSRSDEEYDTDLDVHEEKEAFDMSGRNEYLRACNDNHIKPTRFFLKHMTDEVLNMQHQNLGEHRVKTMAMPLMSNTSILSLNLEDNCLEGKGGLYIARMLKENCYISKLNLAWNKLGRVGTIAICDMLMSNTSLEVLDLSGNEISDAEATYFNDALMENNRVRVLNLSHNQFGDRTSVAMGPALIENDIIEELDFSWNHFSPTGIANICNAIQRNGRLRILNLSFNGVGKNGAQAIANVMKQNQFLRELRLSYCRIPTTGAVLIAGALEDNDMLRMLNLDHNPIGIDGAKQVLRAMMTDTSRLVHLDLSGNEVDKEFAEMKGTCLATKETVILHGCVLGDYIIKSRPKKKKTLFNVPVEDVNRGNILHHLQRFADDEDLDVVEVVKMLENRNDPRPTPTEIIERIAECGEKITEEETRLLVTILLEEVEEPDDESTVSKSSSSLQGQVLKSNDDQP